LDYLLLNLGKKLKNISYFNDKYVGVLGLGLSGNAAANVLVKSNANVFVFDDKKNKSLVPKKTTWLNYKDWDWEKIDTLFVSPGIPINSTKTHEAIKIAKKNNVNILNEIDLFFLTRPSAKIIGVTGTNGKSTTVALLNHILTFNKINSVIGGNFGLPACEIIDPGKNGVIILELSSYQLDGASKLSLHAAAIINITPDHIDYHEDFHNYIKSKLKIISFLNQDSKLIISNDDPFLKKIINTQEIPKSKLIKVNRSIGKNFVQNSIYLSGKHNHINAAIAIALAQTMKLNEEQIKQAINTFKGLPHRLEQIFFSDKIRIINDSKATNGEATAAALSSFKNIFWIAGGRPKSDGIGKASNCLKNVLKIFLFGESSEFFSKQILALNKHIPVIYCETLENATKLAIHKSQNSELKHIIILLSPAAASFDQFKNFEERGDHFKKAVNLYSQKGNLVC
jgi:UDP-N-acetylmuramoylalanine--D-glutamate ligase